MGGELTEVVHIFAGMKKILLFVAAIAAFSATLSAKDGNSIRLIRSATLKINYAGSVFLVDPMLSGKGELKSVLGVNKNPRVHLTLPTDEIMEGVEFVLASHIHFDHLDQAACDLMRGKNIPLYAQPEDTAVLRQKFGYPCVKTITDSITIDGVTVLRTRGEHGRGELKDKMGPVSGFVLKANGAPTVYIIGDCVWTDEIKGNIAKYRPDYVVINSGGAINPKLSPTCGPILMDERDVVDMILSSPSGTRFIAVHMEALDHCQTTRTILRNEADRSSIPASTLIIPADGETVKIR